jgi:UDP-N-acetylmuramoyl-tripeptide--D-alanyl-D-alanine ligase
VINADDEYAPLWLEMVRGGDALTFGLAEEADVRAVHARAEPAGAPAAMEFELRTPEGRQGIRLPLPGMHNVRNALAAAACAIVLGIDARDIAAGLLNVRPAPGRLSWRKTLGGARLLDDTYNANPTSLRAGIELLLATRARHWLVLGDMGELGRGAEQLHFAAGEEARQLGIERLYTVGTLSRETAKGFGAGAVHFDDVGALVAEVRERLSPDVAVLVKGSRSSRMERVVAGLTGEEAVGGGH